MTEVLPDIPRLLTGGAEWLGCLVYLLLLPRRFGTAATATIIGGGLGVLIGIQLVAGRLPLQFWTLTMALAVAAMFGLIRAAARLRTPDAAYVTLRAFVLAEFIASLAWQLHLFFFDADPGFLSPAPASLLALVFVLGFGAAYLAERRHFSPTETPAIGPRTFAMSLAIALITFALSNLSFVTSGTPFSGSGAANIFYIRTLVDLCGFGALYAQHEQMRQQRADAELAAMNAILTSQHQQYLQSREEIELANRTYHDLKHQIIAIRAELDPERRSAHIDELESTMQSFGTTHHTGNVVVDTVLTAKARHCAGHQITLTAVADGTVVDHLSAMDLASLLGNALDNAIESTQRLADPEQRLIKVAIFAQGGFAMLRFENYFDGVVNYTDGQIATRKTDDAGRHGLGLKSIRHIAAKYGGDATVDVEQNWFTLSVLLPRD